MQVHKFYFFTFPDVIMLLKKQTGTLFRCGKFNRLYRFLYFEVLYERLTKMSALSEVRSVLQEAKHVAAHKVGDFFNNRSNNYL